MTCLDVCHSYLDLILFTLISLLTGFSDHYQIFFVFIFLPVSSLNVLLFGRIPFPSRWERMVLGRTGVLAGVSFLSRRGCWGRREPRGARVCVSAAGDV